MGELNTATSSSSDEFEDAEDELGPLPDLTSPSLQNGTHKGLPHHAEAGHNVSLGSSDSKAQNSAESPQLQPSTSTYVNLLSPTGSVSQIGKEPASTSRRGRLSVLRGRMQREFGGVLQGGLNPAEDDAGSTSESASLASWGRNLIMDHSTLNVGPFFPSDSMSTKAFSMNVPATPENPCVRTLLMPDNHAPQVPSRNHAETTLKPPSGPPPPLPLSPCPPPQRSVQMPPRNATPPPLPPRNPTLRLPTALPPQVVTLATEAASFVAASPQPSKPAEQETSSVSNDSIASINNYARCRGHAKTNSLDRGLSLAKCMKTGPFPPPANKSNSLKREYSTEGADASSFLSLDGGEEDLRNSDAQGVIHQITSSILKEDTFKDDVSSGSVLTHCGGDGRLSAVGEETCTPLPTPTSSCVSKPEIGNCQPISIDADGSVKGTLHGDGEKDSLTNKLTLETENSVPEVNARGDAPSERQGKHYSHGCIDPISRDLERRMSMKGHQQASNQDDASSSVAPSTIDSITIRMKGFGSLATDLFRGAAIKAKSFVTSSSAASKLPKEYDESGNESERDEAEAIPIVRPKSAKRGPFDFDGTRLVQELNNEHTGAVWCMKFSLCGRLLATAGQDNIVRVWVLRNHLAYFNSMRERYNAQCKQGSSSSIGDNILRNAMQQIEKDFRSSSTTLGDSAGSMCSRDEENESDNCAVMAAKPLCTYRGHTADVLDLSWSRSYFILSSGMDRTVKLWHLSRPECLCCFQHMDFVTCVAFMPKDDRYFLSGSLDGKLRLWHIPDKKVALWNEVEQVKFITAIAFVKNGKFAVVGTYDGRCFFYSTDQLKYHTVIDVRSSRGKNARGHKITGLSVHGDKLLVTSNDSRIRMYDLRDMALTCKFKGAQNERSQIPAAFSPDGKHIVCGSEDRYIYVWSTADLPSSLSVRKDRNDAWQRIRCHSACVSAAIFAPRPALFLSLLEHRRGEERRYESGGHIKSHDRQIQGDVIISADLQGSIKILANRTRIKAGASNFFPTGIV